MGLPCIRNTVVLLTLSGLLVSCGDDPAEGARPPAQPPSVEVAQVSKADVPVTFEFVGRTASTRKVEIRSRVEGFIESREYEEGTLVQAGDPMFVMDHKPFEAALKAANAERAQQVAREETARANLDRIKPLVERNAVPRKDLDDAEGSWRSAKAAVEAAAAKVTQAELNLSYCDIMSPVTGVSSFAVQQEGAYVGMGSGSLLTYVAQIDPIFVEFSISENQILMARANAASGDLELPDDDFIAEIMLADGTSFPAVGRITFADASLSERTGTFLMRAEFPNPASDAKGLGLRPGQFVRLQLKGAVRPDAVLLPQRAVQHGAKGSFVWVIDKDGKAEFRPVVTGAWKGDDWLIRSGLDSGETVVVEGAQRLRAGVPVTIVEDAPAAGTEG
jgi:membrane fusion protein (multidrug efflux system)